MFKSFNIVSNTSKKNSLAIAATALMLTGIFHTSPIHAGQTGHTPSHQEAIAQAADGIEAPGFTIRSGELVEAIYINATDSGEQVTASLLPAYREAVAAGGGEYLATFEVVDIPKGDRAVTHIALVQWPDSNTRAAVKDTPEFIGLNSQITDVGFFATQQDTPVLLSDDKIYDFTSAWTIASEPAQMEIVAQVLGTYFEKITPALEKYQISQTAFFAPNPGAPQDETQVHSPDLSGIFQWQSVDDRPEFISDPLFTDHVDIRDAIMQRMEVIMTRAIL